MGDDGDRQDETQSRGENKPAFHAALSLYGIMSTAASRVGVFGCFIVMPGLVPGIHVCARK
jgi:hypothetical protein